MQVINRTTRVYTVNGVRMMPGVNTVPDDQAAGLKKHKAVMQRIDAGTLQFSADPKPSMPKAKKDDD